jgi:hypothetical protein
MDCNCCLFLRWLHIIQSTVLRINDNGVEQFDRIRLFYGGIIGSILEIIGIYLWKTYDEVNKRPVYIARNQIGFELDPMQVINAA